MNLLKKKVSDWAPFTCFDKKENVYFGILVSNFYEYFTQLIL